MASRFGYGANRRQAMPRYRTMTGIGARTATRLIISSIDHVVPAFSQKPIRDQAIYEITPGGAIVWQWVVLDHLAEFGISDEGIAQIKQVLAHWAVARAGHPHHERHVADRTQQMVRFRRPAVQSGQHRVQQPRGGLRCDHRESERQNRLAYRARLQAIWPAVCPADVFRSSAASIGSGQWGARFAHHSAWSTG